MKVLKDFVRQKARPEGSMSEGWLAQESLFYISEFLLQIDPSSPRLWDDVERDEVIGEKAQGMGSLKKLTPSLRDKISTFMLYNSGVMDKWLELYELEKKQRAMTSKRQRSNWRRRGQSSTSRDIEPLPNQCTTEWMHDTLKNAKAKGQIISDMEWEFARGCDWKVSFLN